MPFFQYTATDKTGRTINGTLQAATSDAALQALLSAGLSTVDVRVPKKQVAVQARPSMTPTRHVVDAPARTTTAHRSLLTASLPAAAQESVKTKPGNDKDLYFLLTQLSDFYRSGISPGQALQHLADRSPELYKESLVFASGKVGEGGSLSDALSRYPNLYPAHVVGCIRAGEAAGFVPDAVRRMAQTVHSARRIGAKALIFFLMAAVMVAITPLLAAVINGSLASIRAQDAAGGSLPVGGTILSGIGQQLKFMLPLALVFGLGLWGLLWYWKQAPMRRMRHRLGLLPPLQKRAQAEAMQWVSWSLGMATRAGLPHQAAYQLAVESIPNLHIRERAMEEALLTKENEPLSIALSRSTILPREYADMIHNGELAGNVPGALEKMGNASGADFESRDGSAGAILMVVLYIPLGLLTLGLVVYLATSWYKGLIDWGLNDAVSLLWREV